MVDGWLGNVYVRTALCNFYRSKMVVSSYNGMGDINTALSHLLFLFFIMEAWSFSGRKEIPACYLFPLQLPCEDGSPIFLPRSDRVPKYFSPNLFYSAVSIGNLQPMLLLNGNEIIGCTLRR